MKLSFTVETTLTFVVCEYIGTEGGMDYQSYGDEKITLQEALQVWRLAKIADPKADWIIKIEPTEIVR